MKNSGRYDIIIVGGGVAGRTLAYSIGRANPNLRMAMLHSSQKVPCSLHSLGIVSTFGMKADSGPRGESICTAVAMAETFFESVRPSGVERVPHFFGGGPTKSCYLITPKIYLNWLAEHTPCEYGDEEVEVVESGCIRTSSGKVFESAITILASGAYTKKDDKFFPAHPFIAGSSIVKGSYGVFDGVDWGERNFVFSCGSANLVYRWEEKSIVIGGTTDREEGIDPNVENIKNQYDVIANFYALPSFDLIRPGMGLRHRGPKRMPFRGEIGRRSVWHFGTVQERVVAFVFGGRGDAAGDGDSGVR